MLPIRWRLTIFHAVAILGIATVLLALLLAAMIRGVTASVQDITEARALQVAGQLEAGPPPDPRALATLARGDVYIVVRDGEGRVLAESDQPTPGIEAFGPAERAAIWREALAAGRPASRRAHELYAYAVPLDTGYSAARVVEAWKSYDREAETFVPFARAVPFAVPLGAVLAILGSYFLARSALSPVDAIVRAARDIGERDLARRLPIKHPRDELGRLGATFNELLARLEVAFAEREETLAQQRRFVADASHELRTPLTSIQGYARMLRQWALDDPATAREGIAAIEREAARMSLLVEGLLRLARGDEGAALARAGHDLGDIAAAAVADARAVAQGRVEIRYTPPGGPIVACVDRDGIAQVAAILLDNAVKYTPAGGGVAVTVGAGDGCATLAVADTGPGIPGEHLPRIFNRFYRVDEARSVGGAGLGLSIARQIAERHGGAITVASVVGVGSTFTVTLPLGGTAADPPAAAVPAPGGAPRRP